MSDLIHHPNKAAVVLAIVGATALAGVVQLMRIWPDPDFVYLKDRGGANWIYHNYTDFGHLVNVQEVGAYYHTRFNVVRRPYSPVLEVQGLKLVQVELNGRRLRSFREDDLETWKQPKRINLAPYLIPGENYLEILVVNFYGPAAVWARCPELGIYTDEDWGATAFTQLGEVELCRAPQTLPSSFEFGPAAQHFRRALPWLLPIFVVAFFVGMRGRREHVEDRITDRTARLVVVGLVAALLLLGLNNMFRLDYRYGFDPQGHYDYIHHVAKEKKLPLAPDGWQMFQSPLYYLLAAPVYALTTPDDADVDFDEAELSGTFHFYPVRIVSILCGALHPVVAYLFAGLAWPNRPRLKIFATLFGGLIPVNIYMSQFVGNENLMGILGAVVVLLGAYVLKSEGPPSFRLSAACGLALGLALLAKASAMLLIPVCIAAFASRFWGRERGMPDFLKKAGVVAAVCFVVSGWYYVRNWILLGEPFVGGWESRNGMEWWQAPGYRMFAQYARFGMALTYPVHAAFVGIWDSLYSTLWLDGMISGRLKATVRPEWSAALLGASAWVAILPTIALFAGGLVPVVGMIRKPDEPWTYHDRLQLFTLGTVGIYVAAIVYMHLTVPIWIWGKASYMTATTPALAFLATRGYVILRNRGRIIGAIVFAWFACWFFTAYATYVALAPVKTEF